ncbi:hypothetical protein [Hazenella coriacea]|uniref:Uncharacterized protein n=1 Tax=Hazenella coriacea TaxID=1179467 RepID=A0A4R3L5Y1_9BACL|nr:hypothetical protein [Hazenella coriacea]TCS92789.1 hypothetical protein EDD58_11015 [Hazenella coriacea]
MRLLTWAIFWIASVILVTGVISFISSSFDWTLWQTQLRMAAGLFFLISLVVGGVLTTDAAYRKRSRAFYREEWSFICIIVTISLFGISLFM